ncbi:endoglycosylceramidase [Marchantia polymorpha subsp. ruderalis]
MRSFSASFKSAHRLVLLRSTLIALLVASAWGLDDRKAFRDGRIAAAEFHVDPDTGRIQDGSGRERIFHGLNVVMKGPPWHPQIGSFDPQLSFTDADVALLKEWGMNVVRLGVMWPGLEPKRGVVNSTYLEIMQTIVRKLHSAGIYTLLEFHQDLFASQFCGEGLPSWIFDDTDHTSPYPVQLDFQQSFPEDNSDHAAIKQELERTFSASKRRHSRSKESYNAKRYPASFPEPLGKRWPSEWEKDGWEPSVERCNKHTWWWYYFSYAVSRAFQDLYENKWGWGDLLARYWTTVAQTFKDEPGVIGYELMNEPWPGDIFRDPLLLLPGVADSRNLARFYENLQAAVRSVDPEKLLFFETITFDNFWCGLKTVPGGQQWQNKTVLSYHYYTPPNFSSNQAFSERLKESRRLRCGSMLTEFFISTENKKKSKKFWQFRDRVLESAADVAEGTEGAGPSVSVAACDTGLQKRSGMDCSRARSSSKATGLDWKITDGGFQGQSSSEESGQILTNSRVVRKPQLERSDNSVDGVLKAADAHVQSWIGWEYKAFYTKTGSVVELSLFGDDGELNIALAKKLARTYPRAVSGNIRSFSFDPVTSSFFMSYVAGSKGSLVGKSGLAITEIFVHRKFYYESGLSVEVNHNCASVAETTDLVIVGHSEDCVGLIIDVRISQPSASGFK